MYSQLSSYGLLYSHRRFFIMKKFTLSQGKMMIKLISRETDKTSYALIKEFRGGFVAWWWQVFAKIVGADLKDDFDIPVFSDNSDALIFLIRIAVFNLLAKVSIIPSIINLHKAYYNRVSEKNQ